MSGKQKLELTRIGKDKRQNPESRILREEQTLFTVEWALK
ncbi:hypothetical protein SAMN06297164_1626 [Nitrosomonas ureae]|uniref:Uncharacterized protein n=1 Tax=Nitrosomonas ureae TaxID=44577 RepID=A0A286A924_9PROT|nr:hypothetical protein SAMN06297164_1626 [Nitrosomonas ureae]